MRIKNWLFSQMKIANFDVTLEKMCVSPHIRNPFRMRRESADRMQETTNKYIPPKKKQVMKLWTAHKYTSALASALKLNDEFEFSKAKPLIWCMCLLCRGPAHIRFAKWVKWPSSSHTTIAQWCHATENERTTKINGRKRTSELVDDAFGHRSVRIMKTIANSN